MKNQTLLISFLLLSIFCYGQRSATDKMETKKGSLSIQPILHGTVVLTWDNKTIYIDPYGGAKAFEGISAPDIIFITDIHGDHMSLETLESIETSSAIIIAPKAVEEKLPDGLKSKMTIIANGEKIEKLGIGITALPMYNIPEDAESRHTKGRGNGYILTLGGKNIYFSGDTEDIPEMRALKNIDAAFLCMNLPFTMDINQASSATLAFKPKIVYPYHYRGQGGLADLEAFKKLVNDGNPKIDVRIRNWYPSYE